MTISIKRSSHLVDRLLKERLQEFLEAHALIGRDQEPHFVVAYSGGRDSTALLHSLAELKAEATYTLKITVAYYWHPWRPLQDDLEVIHQNCKALKLPWVTITPDLTLPKTETAARKDRYHQLTLLCKDLNATAVLTGHHQDDHVETILFRLLRGTGIEGLEGIPEVRMLSSGEHTDDVCLARPFLHIPRTEIDNYVTARGLRYAEDPTNTDVHFKRNYIRHELLPKIDAAFPKARDALMQLGELVEGEMEIIDNKMDEVWHDVYNTQTKTMDEIRFNQLAHPYQRRVIRRYLEENDLEAGYHKVEEVIDFLSGKKRELYRPALFSLGVNRFLMVYRNRITLEVPQKRDILPVTVGIPAQVSHRDLRATLTIIPLTAEQRLRPIDFSKVPEDEAYVDLSRYLDKEIMFRARRQGDRIRPLGMENPMRLKRFLINRCIPRFQRDTLPLLAADSEVLWVVGVGLSEEIRVKDRPTHLIKIKRGNPS
jgi:tRNA(Ile)-lysidine synthase